MKNKNEPTSLSMSAEDVLQDQLQELLEPRQATDFYSEMNNFLTWMITRGLTPTDRVPTGYEPSTATNYLSRIGNAFPYFWEKHGSYRLHISNELADWYIEQLEDDAIRKNDGTPYAASTKRKHASGILAYKRWRHHKRGGEPWQPHTLFDVVQAEEPVADPITRQERKRIREQVLEYNTVKQYNNCTPEERDRLRGELAQRLGKPKADVTKADWEHQNRCWKYPSMIYLSLDTGLRPLEVASATVNWVRLSDAKLVVPKGDAAKNNAVWKNPITDRTVNALRRWLRQRNAHPAYDDTDRLWLTRENNPYSSGPLGRLLRSVMRDAEIDISDRDISWYSLRHSLGTYYATVTDDIDQVRRQLRHKTIEATLRYIHPPEETVRDTLNKL